MVGRSSFRHRTGLAAIVGLAAFASARFAAAPVTPVSAAVTACEQLTSLAIPNVTVSSAIAVPAGSITLGRAFTVPAFCRVQALAAPTPDSHINLEVWIPAANWNGKFLGTDNGGFSGAIGYAAMVSALNRGYATAGTDTGHTGDQMDFGIGHPEKIVDWAYRAIHVMTETAKAVIRDHEGRGPEHAYFSGCSTGGQQALSEAQRYPEDYDGIVAGDPGNDRLNLIYGFLWSWLATHRDDGTPILPSSKLPLLAKSSMAACDAIDGLADGVIDDPAVCHFDPAALTCRGAEVDSCLTPAQVAAVQKVYDGTRNPRTGEPIFPGWARGSESGWGTYITNPREPVRVALFRGWAFTDPAWDMKTFDWDRDVRDINARFPFLNATSTDLRGFKARGGRLVMYTGLADPVVPPQAVVNYYDRVVKANGGEAATRSFFRFFPVPGMAHCSGGVGPSQFDSLGALEAWVEQGTMPESIIAFHATGGIVDRTRPLCAYPAKARYTGTGSLDEAANFACVADAATERR
jgi:feruloyl esterase